MPQTTNLFSVPPSHSIPRNIFPRRAEGVFGGGGPAVAIVNGVFPAGTKPYGKSYAEWSAEWWQWALLMPATKNPLFDTAPADFTQPGHVWFLGGRFCTPGGAACDSSNVARTITVPAGTAFFFPLLNTEWSTLEGNGNTEAELRAAAKAAMDGAAGPFCEIDGKAVPGINAFRVQSPLFNYHLASHDNLLAVLGGTVPGGGPIPNNGTSQAISDGFYIMVPPLSKGAHTLHFGGAFPGFGFTLDVTYNVNVT